MKKLDYGFSIGHGLLWGFFLFLISYGIYFGLGLLFNLEKTYLLLISSVIVTSWNVYMHLYSFTEGEVKYDQPLKQIYLNGLVSQLFFLLFTWQIL